MEFRRRMRNALASMGNTLMGYRKEEIPASCSLKS